MEPGGDKAWLVPSMVSSEFEPDLGNQHQVVFVIKLCSCALDFSVWTLPCSVEHRFAGELHACYAKVIRMTEEEQVFAVISGGVVGKRGTNGLCGSLMGFLFSGGGGKCCIGIGEDEVTRSKRYWDIHVVMHIFLVNLNLLVKRAPGALLGLAVRFLLIGFITKGSFS